MLHRPDARPFLRIGYIPLRPKRQEWTVGLRFRKSFKIAPGVRWNVGLRGSSLSVGRRGATLNFSRRGTRATVGIPGTGLSYSTTMKGSRRRGASTTAASGGGASPLVDPALLGISRTPWKLIVGLIGLALLFVSPWVGLLALLVSLAIPSRSTLATRELERRLKEFHSAVEGLQTSRTAADIDRVLALPEQLNIPAAHLGDAVEQLEVLRELTVLEERGNGPVPVDGAGDVLGSESCFFTAPVFLDKRGRDENGAVYLGTERVVFVGDTRIEVPWENIASVGREGRTLVVQRADRQTPYNFVFDRMRVAARAEWVASKLKAVATG
jgi:hypothetical protein